MDSAGVKSKSHLTKLTRFQASPTGKLSRHIPASHLEAPNSLLCPRPVLTIQGSLDGPQKPLLEPRSWAECTGGQRGQVQPGMAAHLWGGRGEGSQETQGRGAERGVKDCVKPWNQPFPVRDVFMDGYLHIIHKLGCLSSGYATHRRRHGFRIVCCWVA